MYRQNDESNLSAWTQKFMFDRMKLSGMFSGNTSATLDLRLRVARLGEIGGF